MKTMSILYCISYQYEDTHGEESHTKTCAVVATVYNNLAGY